MKYKIFECSGYSKGIWFRLFGLGVSIQIDMPRFFSERNGYRKVRRLGRLSIEFLYP